jgi:hypothetical protein
MNHRQRIYLSITLVFVLSVAMFKFLPSSEVIQTYAALPIVGSLVAALLQIVRDQADHSRQLLIQDSQNRFLLGATSHMADVAFDKHVQFCEEYLTEAHSAVHTLFREGPSPEVLKHSPKLYSLQQKYMLWLTPKIEADLEIFEAALRKIGATAGYLQNAIAAQDRQEKIDTMYKTFADVLGARWMGSEWEGKKLTEELAISTVIRNLRNIHGTEELTAIRTALMVKAGSKA